MPLQNVDVEKELANWFKDAERIVIAGIGNPIRKDDYVGMKIVEDLKGRISDDVCLLECETVPEGSLDYILEFKPSHVLLIDAALLGLAPGSVQLLFPEQIASIPSISTHVLPLKIFCEFIAKMTGSKIALLLIQPEDTDFGEGLTEEIEKVAKKVTALFLDIFPREDR